MIQYLPAGFVHAAGPACQVVASGQQSLSIKFHAESSKTLIKPVGKGRTATSRQSCFTVAKGGGACVVEACCREGQRLQAFYVSTSEWGDNGAAQKDAFAAMD